MSDAVVVSLITGVAVVLSAALTHRRLAAIHVLVNSRLQESLNEIVQLKSEIVGFKSDIVGLKSGIMSTMKEKQ